MTCPLCGRERSRDNIHGKFLYALNSGTGSVSIYSINSNGTLNQLGNIEGLPKTVGFNGIAAL
jgi:6-phosphogluconolactonase (cycloisomerase 2 family)